MPITLGPWARAPEAVRFDALRAGTEAAGRGDPQVRRFRSAATPQIRMYAGCNDCACRISGRGGYLFRRPAGTPSSAAAPASAETSASPVRAASTRPAAVRRRRFAAGSATLAASASGGRGPLVRRPLGRARAHVRVRRPRSGAWPRPPRPWSASAGAVTGRSWPVRSGPGRSVRSRGRAVRGRGRSCRRAGRVGLGGVSSLVGGPIRASGRSRRQPRRRARRQPRRRARRQGLGARQSDFGRRRSRSASACPRRPCVRVGRCVRVGGRVRHLGGVDVRRVAGAAGDRAGGRLGGRTASGSTTVSRGPGWSRKYASPPANTRIEVHTFSRSPRMWLAVSMRSISIQTRPAV